MTKRNSYQEFRPGDLVEVRSEAEIMRSLDANGTLNGLPFMPEMMKFCGKRFLLLRRIEKTCCEAPAMQMREFEKNDVVFLEDLRCSGADHGGCQVGCMIFWKEAWLRIAGEEESVSPINPNEATALRSQLKTAAETDTFVCQSTELARSTVSLSRSRRIWKCFRDVKVGTYRAGQMIGWIVGPVLRKLLRAVRGELPRGHRTRTPTESLNLQPGEWVEIKSVEEIAQTLDPHGRNRGLHFSEDMALFCGGRFRVRNRLDKVILESTGQMTELRDSVILEGVNCGCSFAIGGCPRSLFQYWREIWLRRVPREASFRA